MSFTNTKEETKLDKDAVNYSSLGKWENLINQITSEEVKVGSLQSGCCFAMKDWEGISQYPNEISDDDNNALLNLQRLSLERGRSPFPDFQFELLDNEGDSDGSGCELYLATGTRKKRPSQNDSWEDNWLFQQREPRTGTSMSNNAHKILELPHIDDPHTDDDIDNDNGDDADDDDDVEDDVEDDDCDDDYEDDGEDDGDDDEDDDGEDMDNDIDDDNSDESESSEEEKWDEVRRVQRPCVQTSSSSESHDSESLSSESQSDDESQENEFDDKIPILDAKSETPDSSKAYGHSQENEESDHSEEDESTAHKSDAKYESNNSSDEPLSQRKDKAEGLYTRAFKPQNQAEDSSDESVKDDEEKPSCSSSENPLKQILAHRANSSRPVSGTRSCGSEGSSSDEFEKRAAAYKPRRRASWCYLENPSVVKNKIKRRLPLLPPRVEEDESEGGIKVAPIVNHEALVGLERQMLRRNVHHSSFRAKKASPNFVLNPLYQPDADGVVQNPMRDPIEEPVHQLPPRMYESGYSSCSPDSVMNQMNQHCPLPQVERSASAGVSLDNIDLLGGEMLGPYSAQGLAKSDPSFLW